MSERPAPADESSRLRADLTVAREELTRTLERLEQAGRELADLSEELTRSEEQAISLSQALARVIRRSAATPSRLRSVVRRRDDPRAQLEADVELVRSSAEFKLAWYLRNNIDVVDSGADPVVHFVQVGGPEGRDPGPAFDSSAYLDQHPELRAERVNPLVHHLRSSD